MKKPSNEEQRGKQADKIIRQHLLFSMGAGLIPLPGADFLAVTAVQVDMIRSLSNLYEQAFEESRGKAIVGALAGSGLSRLGASAMIKVIPGFGSLVGGASMAILSGASTFAIGQVFKLHFEAGGTILDFDTSRFKQYYDEQFEKGKKVAQDLKKDAGSPAPPQDQTPPETHNEQAPPPAPIQEQEKTTTNPPPPNKQQDHQSIVQKLRELAELRDAGVLSEEEFQTMKNQLIQNYGK